MEDELQGDDDIMFIRTQVAKVRAQKNLAQNNNNQTIPIEIANMKNSTNFHEEFEEYAQRLSQNYNGKHTEIANELYQIGVQLVDEQKTSCLKIFIKYFPVKDIIEDNNFIFDDVMKISVKLSLLDWVIIMKINPRKSGHKFLDIYTLLKDAGCFSSVTAFLGLRTGWLNEMPKPNDYLNLFFQPINNESKKNEEIIFPFVEGSQTQTNFAL